MNKKQYLIINNDTTNISHICNSVKKVCDYLHKSYRLVNHAIKRNADINIMSRYGAIYSYHIEIQENGKILNLRDTREGEKK